MKDELYNIGGVLFNQPFKVRRFGHIGFFNAENEKAANFYAENLGFRMSDSHGLSPSDPPLVYFTTYGSDHHAVVHVDEQLAAKDPHYPEGITFNQLSFQVGSLKEINDAYHYCVKHGIKIYGIGRDFPGSNWALYFYGPEGVLVELFYGMEQIGWQRESKPPELYLNGPIFLNPHNVPDLPHRSELAELLDVERTSPLSKGFRGDVDQPFQYDVGGVSLQRPFAVNKIGPVAIFLQDVAAAERFYVDHLGMTVSEVVDWQGHRCVYLRAGPEHHLLALLPIEVRTKINFPSATKLMSLGIELGSYQQLRDARTFFRARGVDIIDDVPAALHPGVDYAFYLKDPSGHTLMFYYYMEQIGWEGRPRPSLDRRQISDPWPEHLNAMSDTYMDQLLQGPLA